MNLNNYLKIVLTGFALSQGLKHLSCASDGLADNTIQYNDNICVHTAQRALRPKDDLKGDETFLQSFTTDIVLIRVIF
jgi:hypothetical protein